MELLKETPHQNEDVLFTSNGNRRSANNNQKHFPTLSVVVGGGEDKPKLEVIQVTGDVIILNRSDNEHYCSHSPLTYR